MISLAKVLSGKPIRINQTINFYQPTIEEIIEMGESMYWASLNFWAIKRSDILEQETEETLQLDDYEIWKMIIFSSQGFRKALAFSIKIFLKEKVEFFDISHTIYIGEKESGVILDNTFYLLMKELCERITPKTSSASEEGSQYREHEGMSERERQMIEKMRAGEEKINQSKSSIQNPEDYLGNRILGLVAVGSYTFEQVYNMTMLQFNMLLQKYVEIQTFELRTALSPYMSSEDGQNENKFWLD